MIRLTTTTFALLMLTACPTGTGGEPNPGDIAVANAEYSCDGDSATPASLTATSTAAGTIDVDHANYGPGCCPTFSAEATSSGSRIDVTYSLTDDMCDCICSLGFTYTLTGVPAGEWTVAAGSEETSVTVP